KEVVIRRIHLAVGNVEANRKESAILVEEETEIHFLKNVLHIASNRSKQPGAVLRTLVVIQMAPHHLHERICPVAVNLLNGFDRYLLQRQLDPLQSVTNSCFVVRQIFEESRREPGTCFSLWGQLFGGIHDSCKRICRQVSHFNLMHKLFECEQTSREVSAVYR